MKIQRVTLNAVNVPPVTNWLFLKLETDDGLVVGAHSRLVNGSYAVPQSPGLGITLNDQVLRTHLVVKPRGGSTMEPRLG
jgi:L-alanine-DL-glutamate epimerase-like enolase superfamily enzyme